MILGIRFEVVEVNSTCKLPRTLWEPPPDLVRESIAFINLPFALLLLFFFFLLMQFGLADTVKRGFLLPAPKCPAKCEQPNPASVPTYHNLAFHSRVLQTVWRCFGAHGAR